MMWLTARKTRIIQTAPDCAPVRSEFEISEVVLKAGVNGAGYIAAQLVNFGTQILLLKFFGKASFGYIGIAQIYIAQIIFLGELGFPSFFIRAASQQTNWRVEWESAVTIRLAVVVFGCAGLLLYWLAQYGLNGVGSAYILCALPGVLVSAGNALPLVLGQKRITQAATGLLIQWIVFAVIAVPAAALLPPVVAECAVGAAFSIGCLSQVVYLNRCVQWPKRVRPEHAFRKKMLVSAGSMWLPSLAGTIDGLTLTFAMEHLAMPLLPWFVIANQILTGLRGLNLQAQRVFLPVLSEATDAEYGSHAAARIHTLFARLAAAVAAALVSLFYLSTFVVNDAHLMTSSAVFLLLIMELFNSLCSAVLVTQLISQHREHVVTRIICVSFFLSVLGQFIVIAAGAPIFVVLIIRVACTGAQLVMMHRERQVELNATILIVLAALALQCLVPTGQIAATLFAVVYFLVGAVLTARALLPLVSGKA